MKKFFLLLLMFAGSGCAPEMSRQFNSAHFVFFFNKGYDRNEAKDVAKSLEANYARISSDLETQPVDPIQVYLYTSRWAYATTHGHWTSGGNIEGDGKLHFLQHGWDEQSINKIAVHEFSHAVMLKLLLDQEHQPLDVPIFDKKFARFPTWLYEGIAVYEAGQFVDPKTLPFLASGRYPNLDELNDRSKGQKIYKVGYTMIEYILTKYGKQNFIRLIKAYGDLNILGTSPGAFSKDWYGYVKGKYLNAK